MRYEQRICDLCGHKSGLELTHEPAGRNSRLTPTAKTMRAHGWSTIDGIDRCPDCTWMNAESSTLRKPRT